ncbi:MAG: hypothetical protein A2794_00505 [Alphaproteobacteria bacterium RIFCSPHIGHO2_01_FULL_40_8]|nr:MAG: hypothetical protein A2794_00505 [Alphaproteobacteria bacterium RIFCSPHIGHO2_01_FULL_40_8]
MKLIRLIAMLALMAGMSSCAFFNGSTVDLSINSNPPGADIFIEGRNYGRTPAIINIEPKAYTVTLVKEGHGSANFVTDIWYGTVRTDVSGNRTADGTRCVLDMMTVVFSFNSWNRAKCGDFKQKEYFINIPRIGPSVGSAGSGSLIGAGNNPANVVDYYYNQDMIKNDMAKSPYYNPYAPHQNQ